MRGIIKKIIKDKGFGFIEGNNGKEYFFHISNVGKTIENNEIIEGKNVEYQENSGPKGLYASEINFSEDFKKDIWEIDLLEG